MNNYCIHLNLDLKIFNSDLHPIDFIKTLPEWNEERFTKPTGSKHFRVTFNFLNQDFVDFFKNRNLILAHVEVFYTVPYGKIGIHCDVPTVGDIGKINWVYGGADSVMQWFETNKLHNPAPVQFRNKPAAPGGPALDLTSVEVDLVHSQFVISPSLVQVGKPHNMENGPTDRFCIGAIFVSNDTNKGVPMNQSIEIFKDLLVPCP